MIAFLRYLSSMKCDVINSDLVWLARLFKNRAALAGLIYILLMMFISVFCYLIAPDKSHNADFQIIEMQAKKPGHQQLFLKIEIAGYRKPNLFRRIWEGETLHTTLIPINSYRTKGNEIFVDKYVDEDTSVVTSFRLNELTNNGQKKIQDLFVYKTYWLGSDILGRDMLSRLLVGTRVSLTVGLMAVLVALTIGIILGMIAGYYRGKTDNAILWLINVAWSIPTLLFVFALTLFWGKGPGQIYLAIGMTMWVNVARLVRGQMMQLREREFILSAKLMGFSDLRVMFVHALPNMMGPLIVTATGIFASAITIESGLSFLGLGIQPPQPSWGTMIKENYNFIITQKPLLALIPGLAIVLLVLSFNSLSNGLRDALDVKNGSLL
jgi:peptide/nickel transport system permease protein